MGQNFPVIDGKTAACALSASAATGSHYDISEELGKAWDRIVDRLRSEPEELWRRLARRRLPTLTRPPRSWCLCLRASDTRINSCTAACAPSDAAYPRSALGPEVPFRPETHDVTIDKRLLRKVCMPVHLEGYKIDFSEAADMLGITKCGIRALIRQGVFAVKKVAGRHGLRGWRLPIVSCPWPLDPSSNMCQPPDPLWGHFWPTLVSHVPDDFQQILVRDPEFREDRGRLRSAIRFRGWVWRCPGCKKHADRLYYPLPAKELVLLQVSGVERDEVDELPRWPATFACRNCHDVFYHSRVGSGYWNKYVAYVSGGLLYGHEVRRPPDLHLAPPRLEIDPSAMDPWRLAPRVSARKIKKHACRRPAPRRLAIARLFLRGLGRTQIAQELGLSPNTVTGCLQLLCQRHHVKGLKALFAALRQNHPDWAKDGPAQYKRKRTDRHSRPARKRLLILRLMLAGRSFPDIAKTTGLHINAVYQHSINLYRQFKVHGRAQLLAHPDVQAMATG